MLSSAPGTMATASPAASSSAASSVAAAAAARCSASRVAKRKGLRGLGADQALARHGRDDAAGRDALERVGDRHRRDRAGAVQGREQGRDRARRDQRPRRVVDQHQVRRERRQRLQPGANARLARGTPGTSGRCSGRRARQRVPGDRRPAASAARAAPMPRRPGAPPGCRRAERNCFGVASPNRLPDPAATSTAAIVMPPPCGGAAPASTCRTPGRDGGYSAAALAVPTGRVRWATPAP